ncbi:MAG: sigma-70 family RNA polymerase sigma factor [Frankiaceae bacterium]
MGPTPEHDALGTAFAEHRTALLSVAHRIVGRHGDAEDVVQDAWLRWCAVDRCTVLDPRAYLVRVTTRLAIDRLRRGPGRHETAAGTRLPESALTVGDAASAVERAAEVLEAMAVVLATLSPLERAAFVLREAFSLSHAELAVALGRSEPAVRQLASRARHRVIQRTERYAVDRRARAAVTDRFLAACADGDLARLVSALAPGATVDREERIAC